MRYLKSFLESNSTPLEVDSEDVEIIKGLFTDIEDEFDLYVYDEDMDVPEWRSNTFRIKRVLNNIEGVGIKREIEVKVFFKNLKMIDTENLQKKWKDFIKSLESYGYELGSTYLYGNDEDIIFTNDNFLLFGCNIIYKQ